MKWTWYKLLVPVSQVGCLVAQNPSVLMNAVESKGYLIIPQDLVLDCSMSQLVQQVQLPNLNLKDYLTNLGIIVDPSVQKVSLVKIDYVQNSQGNLTSLDLKCKVLLNDQSVSLCHLNIASQRFDYVIKIPDTIDLSYADFAHELNNQTPDTVGKYLSSVGFGIPSGLKIDSFWFDQTNQVLSLNFVDVIDSDHRYVGKTNISCHEIQFLKPDDKVVDNTGLYLGIGVSLVIFLSLGVYLTRFILKVKHYKKTQAKETQDKANEKDDKSKTHPTQASDLDKSIDNDGQE